MLGRTHTRISRLGILGLLPRLSALSRFELTGEARTFFRAVAIAVGISVSLSSASAETEEVSGRDDRVSNYTGYTYTRDLLGTFFVTNYDSNMEQQDDEELTYDMLYKGNESRRPPTNKDTTTHWGESGRSTYLDNFGVVPIPDALWSLDDRSDRVSDGSELDTALGGHDSWTGDLGGWTDMSANTAVDVLLTVPPRFQVASCGGSSPEHSNLEQCNVRQNPTARHGGEANATGGASVASSTTAAEGESVVPSTFTQEIHTYTVHDLSPFAPSGVNKFVLQGDLTYLSIPPNPCDGIFVTCRTIPINLDTPPIDSPTPLIDSPTPLIDSPTPLIGSSTPPVDSPTPPIGSQVPLVDSPAPSDFPDPVIPISDPAPVYAVPIYTAPVTPSVPETSTWIMLMIGVGIIGIAGGRRSRNASKQSVVGTVYKDNRKSLRNHTM
jgi:hypothetical protein